MKEELLYVCIINGSYKCLKAICDSDKYNEIKITLTSKLEENSSKNPEVYNCLNFVFERKMVLVNDEFLENLFYRNSADYILKLFRILKQHEAYYSDEIKSFLYTCADWNNLTVFQEILPQVSDFDPYKMCEVFGKSAYHNVFDCYNHFKENFDISVNKRRKISNDGTYSPISYIYEFISKFIKR